ncbi:glycine cleavage system protein GcvH [Halodesulfovibrio sp.]|jgi:glycine cleavage system H protein|uniref:glycine cleavage system protein GcvH n=1 Tax=Halodesulfovibrio sp. TaxID=1912772 RepID=UPI0025DEDF0A|nr:glycine cleavage system protein GcvH [Halodesulfovibrio sp.]MCT4533885.1 glycine cleavage system protein GcvH [Halodesulfovibrio sp.]MCT4628117.1 glycine cleavage system protein GcvH [Halodesulfovibrio sp.]
MAYPENLLYSKSHEWTKIEGDEATIGITSFAQEQLGDITFVELPEAGDTLDVGDEMGSIESVKAASELYIPVSGEVLAVNEDLEDAPEKVNESPFEGGWLIKIKLNGEPADLLSASEYAELVANEAH